MKINKNYKQTEIGEIPADWQVTTLGGTATLNYGKSLPEMSRSEGGVPVYGSSGVTGCHSQALVQDEGYIIGRKGTIGTVHYSPEPFYPIDTTYYVTKDDIKCDFKYFYYLLKYLNLDKLNFDSAVPGLNRDVAYRQKYAAPKSIGEQQQIASILSSLDDKIELNRKMNKTLEEIGKALFKRWFVDFEFPNEHGKPYKSSGGKMMDSELGEIPEGWKVGKLSEFGKIICGKTPPKSNSEYFDGSTPFIKIPDMHGNTFIVKTEDTLSDEGQKFQQNKTLPKFSLCVSCIATVGLVCITSEESQTNQQINSIIPNELKHLSYLYFQLRKMERKLIDYASGGSATPNLNTGDFANLPVILPGNDLLNLFSSHTWPLFEQILMNDLENTNLEKMKDSLLPRLMSGKLRVN